MTKQASRQGRARICPWIDADLRERLASVAAARGLSEQSVVQAALRQYLDGTRDGALIMRQIDRQGRELQRTHRDVELLTEAFAIWTKIWFAHTAPVPDDAKRAARLLAETRFKQFVDHVTEQFAAGKRFLDDLPREDVGADDELANIATLVP